MFRQFDQPRPIVTQMLRFVSPRYRQAHRIGHITGWQRAVLRRTHFLPALRAAYVLNDKAASSSVMTLLQTAASALQGRGEPGLVDFTDDALALLPVIEDAGVYRFSFVRHPEARALSAFNNLFALEQNRFAWRHRPYAHRTGLRFGDPSPENFDRFLAYVRDAMAESELFCDPHLRLQVHNLGFGRVAYQRIGKVESFAADFAAIAEETGLGTLIDPGALPRVNRSGGAGLRSISAAQKREIRDIYAADFESFGYDGPAYL